MAFINPYESALKVDPNKEKQVLVNLKSDPNKMSELGLSPDTDLASLKTQDPQAYNRVLSYVKSETYKSPAYGALGSGQSRQQFVTSQLGKYEATPSAYRSTIDPDLRTKFGVDDAQSRYNTLSEQAFAAPYNIRETVAKKGGYDIDALKKSQDEAVTSFIDARNKYIRGEMSRDQYISAISGISTSARSLKSGQEGLERETQKALGTFKEMEAQAKNKFENAKNAYEKALELEEAGYTEARGEKIKAAEDMFDYAKDLVDTYRKEEKSKSSNNSADNYDQLRLQLNATKGTDGYVNTDMYKKLRSAAKNKTLFDENFSWMLNPNDPSTNIIAKKTEKGAGIKDGEDDALYGG